MAQVLIEESSLTAIGDAIRGKTGGTTKLVVPDGMVEAIESITTGSGGDSSIDDFVQRTITEYESNSVTKVGVCAFNYCTSLKTVNLPAVTTLESSAFYHCTALETVNLPAVTTIASSVFIGCSALKSIDLPSCTTIRSFSGCTSLTKVTMLNNDGKESGVIDSGAFNGCTNLTALIIRGDLTTIKPITSLLSVSAFTGTPIADGTGYIYVPRIQLDINGLYGYQNVAGWATYKNQFRAIEDYPDICGDISDSDDTGDDTGDDNTTIIRYTRTITINETAYIGDTDMSYDGATVTVEDPTIISYDGLKTYGWAFRGLKVGETNARITNADGSMTLLVELIVES